jgi:hypothetical protein
VLDHRLEVMRSIEPSVEAALATLLPPDQCWQPSEVLPTFGAEGWRDEVTELQAEAARLSDEMLVVLVGNVVTEEALPSYLATINRCGGMTDRTGTDAHPWARWARRGRPRRSATATRGAGTCSSRRVGLLSVERTVQHLLRNGFDNRGRRPLPGPRVRVVQSTRRSSRGSMAGSRARAERIAPPHLRPDRRRRGAARAGVRVRAARSRRAGPGSALEAMEETLAGSSSCPRGP